MLSEHMHFLKIGRQIFFLCMGVLSLLFSIYFLLYTFPVMLLSGKENLIILIVSLCGAIFGIFAGILFAPAPFFTKVIITEELFKYQTHLITVSAEWKDVQIVGYEKKNNTGVVIGFSQGALVPQTWVKPMRWLVHADIKTFHLHLSWFQDFQGHSLESEMIAFQTNNKLC